MFIYRLVASDVFLVSYKLVLLFGTLHYPCAHVWLKISLWIFLPSFFCLEILLLDLLTNVWSVLVCPYLFCFGLSFSFVPNPCCTALRYTSIDATCLYILNELKYLSHCPHTLRKLVCTTVYLMFACFIGVKFT